MEPDDKAEFEVFVSARFPALRRSAFLLTGDWALAEDLVQTALARTYGKWGGLRDNGSFEAYVRRTMATTYTSWWRRKWRAETPTEELPEVAGRNPYDGVDDRDTVLRALATLPRRARAVLVLRYFEDMTEAQIAAALGCSVGTVKSSLSRALARLRAAEAARLGAPDSGNPGSGSPGSGRGSGTTGDGTPGDCTTGTSIALVLGKDLA